VSERDTDEQRDDDHDDQRRFVGAKDPMNLDLVGIEDGEQRNQHSEDDRRPGTNEISSTATLLRRLCSLENRHGAILPAGSSDGQKLGGEHSSAARQLAGELGLDPGAVRGQFGDTHRGSHVERHAVAKEVVQSLGLRA
jgi:hypothetical protein